MLRHGFWFRCYWMHVEKILTEKMPETDMKTHLKDSTASGQTYICEVCGKEFSRADTRKRHEAAHSYSLTCGVCGQYFNRLDILVHHRSHHVNSSKNLSKSSSVLMRCGT
jgi:transcription elongation factor Elf1